MVLFRFRHLEIRQEKCGDHRPIYDLIQSAFSDKDFSSGTEGPIVDALRHDGDLTVSLVATRSEIIVGHIAFSPVSIGEQSLGLYALGPVAADPALRFQGIGSALINEGLARLRAMDAQACVLVGDPNYYKRFGFVGDCGLRSGSLPTAFVQALVWGDPLPEDEIIFAPAFSTGSNQP